MNYCPVCNEEFLDHVSLCSTCHEKLLTVENRSPLKIRDKAKAKEELLKKETIALSEGSLDQCRELEKILEKANISAVVYPAHLGCDDHATKTLGASCAVKYLVLISPEDLERCKEALEGQFEAHVAREGKGSAVRNTVDLSAREVVCPACNECGPLNNNGECNYCGLFLGEHQ